MFSQVLYAALLAAAPAALIATGSTVAIRVTTDRQSRVTECVIVTSSGSPTVDRGACMKVRQMRLPPAATRIITLN